jgi:hypothetical protein
MTEKNLQDVSIVPGDDYEAPKVEVVVTREELEREVHYAGAGISPIPG